MTANSYPLSPHPAPHANRVRLCESFFSLAGGPAAWFIQLCGGYALASQPCFVNGTRAAAPLARAHWTWPAMIILMATAIVVALGALLVSWQAFKRTRHEVQGDEHHLMETGAGRTRFLALWGIALGGGFALATAFTAVGFMTLPRCAG
jgi:hypothetical protein